MTTETVVLADADDVAEAIADRLVDTIAAIQQASPNRVARIALTGGRIATRAYRHLGADQRATRVDWSRVELWWGDERFVAADSTDRNDRGALAALLPALPVPEANLHPMPADDGAQTLDAAAAAYAAELGDTVFDVCLLGVGPDGHVASVFPDHPSFAQSLNATTDVIAVRDSPKPPPLRISLTHPVINRSHQVWFTVSGADKADAVGWATSGSKDVPAGHAHGTEHTIWLLDQAAATRLS